MMLKSKQNIPWIALFAWALFAPAPRPFAQDKADWALPPTTPHTPFRWPSIIADFDNDKQPDLGVIDRVGPGKRGNRYQIGFHLTSGLAKTISFESALPGLTVSAPDIDNDGDFDIIIRELLISEVVQIWLNDGHAEFSEGKPEALFHLTAQTRIHGNRQSAPPQISVPPRRRLDSAAPVGLLLSVQPSASEVLTPPLHSIVAQLSALSVSSRAPPLIHPA